MRENFLYLPVKASSDRLTMSTERKMAQAKPSICVAPKLNSSKELDSQIAAENVFASRENAVALALFHVWGAKP